jgi:hypothetical protein
MECKLRCINCKRASEPSRAFRLAFGVTGISDDWYISTIGVIVIDLRTPQSARENVLSTWNQLGAPATSLGVPTTSLGGPTTSLRALMTALGAPTTSLGAPGSTSDTLGSISNHDKAVWENRHLLCECCWCAFNS